MSLSIISNEDLNLQVPLTVDQHFSLHTGLYSTTSEKPNSSKDTEPCNKFLLAFRKKHAKLFEHSKLDIEFKVKKIGKVPYNKKTEACCTTIIVKGEILRALHDALFSTDEKHNLEILITLQSQERYASPSFSFVAQNSRVNPPKQVTIQGFLPQVNVNGFTDHYAYTKVNANIPISTNGTNQQWTISVDVKYVSPISIDGLLPNCLQENQKRFEQKEKFADFKIFVEEKEILCNKIFLASMSPVISNMLESDCKERTENEMSIEGFSYDGVNALLKFMYYLDVSDAMKSCKVALELYQAADVYQIPMLGRVIAFILLDKPDRWYDVNVALKLLQFVQKVTTGDVYQKKKIVTKMFQILAMNMDKLSNSKLLEELYPNKDGRESFKLLLEMHKPK